MSILGKREDKTKKFTGGSFLFPDGEYHSVERDEDGRLFYKEYTVTKVYVDDAELVEIKNRESCLEIARAIKNTILWQFREMKEKDAMEIAQGAAQRVFDESCLVLGRSAK